MTPKILSPKVLVPLAVVAAVFFLGFVLLTTLGQNSDTAVSAKALAEQIQEARVTNILNSCVAQNERHDDTIKKLDFITSQLPPDKQVEAKKSRAGTVLLIDALAPKRDCAKVVEQQAKATPAPR